MDECKPLVLGDATDAALLRYCDTRFPVSVVRRIFPAGAYTRSRQSST